MNAFYVKYKEHNVTTIGKIVGKETVTFIDTMFIYQGMILFHRCMSTCFVHSSCRFIPIISFIVCFIVQYTLNSGLIWERFKRINCKHEFIGNICIHSEKSIHLSVNTKSFYISRRHTWFLFINLYDPHYLNSLGKLKKLCNEV